MVASLMNFLMRIRTVSYTHLDVYKRQTICSVQPGYGNTAPIQLELDPGMARDEEGIQKVCDYILTIFDQGATLLNINIINADEILAANENPDLYPDLVVRVTGFTAYFCLLTPEFRQLVVERIIKAS